MFGLGGAGGKTCNADFFDALEVIEQAPSWRDRILERAGERDRRMEGMRDLYEQYAECRSSLQALREAAPGRRDSPSSAGSPRASADDGAGDFEFALLPSAPRESAGAPERQEAARGEWVRCQELEALRQLLKEREEELSERDVAYAEVRYQNAELRAELKRAQDQLQEVAGHGAHARGGGTAAKQK